MTSLRRALWCLAAAGFVFGVIDLALILTSDFAPHVMGPFGLVIGWGFIGAGLFAWSRRPDNRVGMLMAATGFAWLLAGLGLSDIPLLFALGSAFGSVYFATAVHMLLAAYASTGLAVAGLHAWLLRRDSRSTFHRHALTVALWVGAPAALLQPLSGDISAQLVARAGRRCASGAFRMRPRARLAGRSRFREACLCWRSTTRTPR